MLSLPLFISDKISKYSQLSPCRHPTIINTSYYGQTIDQGLTGNDSCYYGIMDTFVVQKNNLIVLTIDKADKYVKLQAVVCYLFETHLKHF